MILALIGLLLWTGHQPLQAQSRASVQVAARVVEAAPSRQALGLARLAATRERLPLATSLASVQVEAMAADSAGRRSRRVTIAFLRN